MKIIDVIIAEFGGFCLTESELKDYCEIKGIEVPEDEHDRWNVRYDVERDDRALVEMAKRYKEEGIRTNLEIAKAVSEHPDFDWEIQNDEGYESIAYYPTLDLLFRMKEKDYV